MLFAGYRSIFLAVVAFFVMTAGTCSVKAVSEDPMETLRKFRAPDSECREMEKGCLWIEAESFSDYGGWVIDTQFVHKMGSAYLISKGVLKPSSPAKKTITVPVSGNWHVWVRTRDWLPEFSPGRFTVEISGNRGRELGASGKPGWRWEKAGMFHLEQGKTDVALVDLSGGFARCDAIFLSMNGGNPPPDDGEALASARIRYAGGDATIADGGEYDVVVVGAGPGGLGASLAASRLGMRTVLIHDRPVLGGNNSIEHSVTIGGSGHNFLDGVVDSREGGILEEARLARQHLSLPGRPRASMSAAYRMMVDAEEQLSERPNERVVSAEKKGRSVVSVMSVNTLTGCRTSYRGKVFVDGTGDGWIGYFAGASRMYGREAKSQYGEMTAPEKADTVTMSGCINDYGYHETKKETRYETPAWAKVLPDGFNRHDVRGVNARWWLEHSGYIDDIEDPEAARDELIRIHLDYWGWIRRHPKYGALARKCVLDEIKICNGRREGWRLMGDYVLTDVDCIEGRVFPDAITVGGWLLDVHDPLGVKNPKGNGKYSANQTRLYTIPYRCVYSRDLDNLYMAGRNISVTHAALGSTRIMGTIFSIGQAVGTASAMLVRTGLSSRELGERKIRELQQLLVKNDQYIRGVVGNDSANLAKKAKISASSTIGEYEYGMDDPDFKGVEKANWAWRREVLYGLASCFPRGNIDRLEKVDCYMKGSAGSDRELTMEVYESDDIAEDEKTRTLLGSAKAKLKRNGIRFLTFKFDTPLKLSKKYVWLKMQKAEGVYWFRRKHIFAEGGTLAVWQRNGNVRFESGYQSAFVTTPRLKGRIDAKPEYVIDGHGRPDTLPAEGVSTRAWRSDPVKSLPQWVQLKYDEPVSASEIRIVFDSGLCGGGIQWPHPPELVKDYALLGLVDGKWLELAVVKGNWHRLRIHRFESKMLSAVKVRVDATWGVHEARIQEISVY